MNINLERLQVTVDQQAIVETLIKWTANSSNEDLLIFRDCCVRLICYTQTLEAEISRLDGVGASLSDDRLNSIVRARKAEESLQNAAEEIERLKKQLKLFI
tara:strand:- start:682 stop:984 length:303 start_codon:yes stop_codon:yes gene_type:complete